MGNGRDKHLFFEAMQELGVDRLNEPKRMAPVQAEDMPFALDEPQEVSDDERQQFLDAVMDLNAVPQKDKTRANTGRREGLRKLRSAKSKQDKPDEVLDLHGMRAQEAQEALMPFVLAGYRRGLKSAIIITGKGLHSAGGVSVLKPMVERWILGAGKRFIRAYAEAPRAYGGRGAYIVYFRED